MDLLKLLWLRFINFPLFFALVAKDFFIWIKTRGWTQYDAFGIHIYLGAFGQGKTCSMVRDVYNLCCKYKDLKVLTNVDLKNFPEWTEIIPLRCARDIINAAPNTLIVIDEIGTIWNSRDFMNRKKGGGDDGSLSKPIFQILCQVRHRNIEMFATAQDWADVDVQLRRKIRDVTVCSAWFSHPFSRMITNRVYNAREYDLFYGNPLLPLLPIDVDVYVQTDKLRKLYDTTEMVETMLQMDYIPTDDEDAVAPAVVGTIDKSEQKKLLSKMRKGGII